MDLTKLLLPVALAALALLPACRPGPASASAAASAPAEAKTYPATGVVEGFQSQGQVIVIKHEAIPGLMDAMTMAYELRGLSLAAGLKAGDKVDFTLSVKDDDYTVTALKKR